MTSCQSIEGNLCLVKPCLLIPIYDHPDTIRSVVAGLASLDLPCLIVDDGSAAPTRQALEKLQAEFSFVRVQARERNGGRGAALKTGYRWAHEEGFSHALQLDADDQHDPHSAPAFLAESRANPEALVLGDPVFDESAPRSRLYGRRISQFWVWVDSLSMAVHDPLCGMRCIPLAKAVAVLDGARLGDAMSFDPELCIRLQWAGVPVSNVRTEVRYFPDGISHFHMVEDNLRLSGCYGRLLVGMLVRSPALLARKLRAGRS